MNTTFKVTSEKTAEDRETSNNYNNYKQYFFSSLKNMMNNMIKKILVAIPIKITYISKAF